jgi:hypothetical protein
MAFSAKIVGDELVLRIPLNAKPEKSASGKTLVVASTYGNKETDCVVDGKKVIVGVNAYIPKKEGRAAKPVTREPVGTGYGVNPITGTPTSFGDHAETVFTVPDFVENRRCSRTIRQKQRERRWHDRKADSFS